MLSEADPLGHTRSRTYSPAGLVLSETDASGATTGYEYDVAALARRYSIERPRLAAVLSAARRAAERPFEAIR